MGSNLGLIGFGLVALFATSMIKFVAIAAIALGCLENISGLGRLCNESIIEMNIKEKSLAFC